MTALRVPSPPEHAGWRGALVVFAVSTVTAVAAWFAAVMGPKSMAAGVGVLVFVIVLLVCRKREEVVLATAVLSMALVVRKALGPLSFVPSGAAGLYVSSFDVLLGLLYGMWLFSGTMGADLRRVFRRRVMWLPLVGVLCSLPSLLVAGDLGLSAAELFRMASLYLVFVYFAARIRSRRHVQLVLGAFGAIVVVELAIVLGQKLTGGPLGLAFLGTPTTMVAGRVTEDNVLNRPFGTINHPVFMAAFLSQMSLLALALALGMQRTRRRLCWLALAGAAAIPLIVSQTRAAALGMAVAAPALVIWALVTRRLRGRTLAGIAAGVLLVATLASPYLLELYRNNFKTDHFGVEVESRTQLNQVAIDMFYDAPVIGHGLNNFQAAAPPYEGGNLIFAGNPVHNMALLQLAETGIVGFVGLVVVGFGMLRASIALARSRDRLYSAVGAAGAAIVVFFVVEEQLLFALRQEAPRTLAWVIAGLVVACLELSRAEGASGVPRGRHRRPAPPRPTRPRTFESTRTAIERPRRRARRPEVWRARAVRVRLPRIPVPTGPRTRRAFRAAGGVAAFVLLAGLPSAASGQLPPSTAGLDVLVGGADRATGRHGIYRMEGDRLVRISPDDGLDYFWPEWALGGTKIVFSARQGPEGSPEAIYMSNADGTDRIQLTSNPWRNQQPKVSPDGRRLVFSSSWPQFEHIGLFELDLTTLQVTNLSSVSQQAGAFDADPRYTAGGSRIVFANTASEDLTHVVPTQVDTMALDGTDRRRLLEDGHYNVDPTISPDGRSLAVSAYRGSHPASGDTTGVPIKLGDWFIPVRDLAAGTEVLLNQGLDCSTRAVDTPCAAGEGSGWNPLWTPDGRSVGFISALSSRSMCVCVNDIDGTDPRILVETSDVALTWFSWTEHEGAPDDPAEIGSARPESRLLFVGGDAEGGPELDGSTPDRWGELRVPLPDGFAVRAARWSADRRRIVFEAVAPAGAGGAPLATSSPPAGSSRQRHHTLDVLDRLLTTSPIQQEPPAEAQVFVMDADGANLRRVTSPTTEDWRDAVPDGEQRANVDPDISPDGRHVVFTNVSSRGESFVVRVDLQTGDTLNLTNGTAGAVAVADGHARFSPDGRRIVFSSTVGGTRQVFTMDLAGLDVRPVTDDGHVNLAPSWSPDGTALVYSSYRAEGIVSTQDRTLPAAAAADVVPLAGWSLIHLDLATGEERVLVEGAARGAFNPVWSPDGTQVAYVSLTPPGQPDIWMVNADGTGDHPVQVTQRTLETSVDWR